VFSLRAFDLGFALPGSFCPGKKLTFDLLYRSLLKYLREAFFDHCLKSALQPLSHALSYFSLLDLKTSE
jgi:hypothetical protein